MIRTYRRLLGLLPAAFRSRYADDMTTDLEEMLAKTPARGPERLRLIVGVAVDLAATLASEWRRAAASLPRTRPDHPRRSTMDSLRADVRSALRSVRRYPVVSAVAILTLALGIGTSTAVYALVHRLLLAPLPYHDPDRLVLVWPEATFNKAMVRRIAEAAPALERISGISNWTFTLTGEPGPEEVLGSLVSPHHFELLGVQPAIGRAFRPEEGGRGRDGVVILSHSLWMRRFGGDTGILGRSIPLSGDDLTARTVIGVMPDGYRPIAGDAETPLFWVPLPEPESWSVSDDNSWYVNYRVARLAPGATAEQATAQVRAEARRLRGEGLDMLEDEAVRTADVVPLRRDRTGEVAGPLWVLLGTVALVLLIACANVANLLLARGERRERELAVRRALGAGGLMLARQLLLESLALGVAGGAAGVAVAFGALRLLGRVGAGEVPRLAEVTLDAAVLAFAVVASLAATALSGVVPALRGARRAVAAELRRGGRAALGPGRGRRLPGWLVAGEVALALVVAVASGLMLRSLHALYAVDPGLRPERVLLAKISPPGAKYGDAAAYNALYDRVQGRLERLPGVRSAGAIQLLPLTWGNWSFPSHVEGHPVAPGDSAPSLNFRVIRPGWFQTAGIPLRAGRHLLPADGLGDAPDLAVVNEALARRFWPEDPLRGPIGREIRIFSPQGPPVRVVGVVGDVRQHALDQDVEPELYVTAQEWSWPVSLWMALRVDGDPLAFAPVLRAAVWEVDRDVPIGEVRTLGEVVVRSARTRRFLAFLLGGLGGLALVLGAVGVFGVTAYAMARRTSELGLRKALGATDSGLLADGLRRGMRPVAAGVLAGAAIALWTGRLLASHLYGVTPRDPLTLAATALLLLAVGAAATALPAWRASRVDPIRAMGDG